MAELFAYCGLVCQTCPIYVATRLEDKEKQVRMRTAIARECEERYGLRYEPKDIGDCDGCRTEGGRLFSGSQGCAIRKCAREKGVENCAYCSAYVCQELQAFLAAGLGDRKRLDDLRTKVESFPLAG